MVLETGSSNAEDRIVVGYFSSSEDASRAINELIDEGFAVSEIGAAFRSSGSGALGGGRVRGGTPENPAVSGSIGGAGSHDEAVTPAGLAPGSGNAFPAPSRPAEAPGTEIPSTLRHELPHDLPSTLQGETAATPISSTPAPRIPTETNVDADERRRERLHRTFGENRQDVNAKRDPSRDYGTGEGHLFPDYQYSETSFENSFVGMGLNNRDARALSGRLNRGGAVVSVAPGTRAALAEGIIERNRGRVRFENLEMTGDVTEGDRVEVYGRMRNYYRPEGSTRRMAS